MNLDVADSFLLKLKNSRRGIYRFTRVLFLLLFVVLAIDNFRAGLDSLAPELSFKKDFLQDYLLATATISGEDPYQPVSVLEKKFLDIAGDERVFFHPTPHPPTLIPYILWLPNLDYGVAASVWMISSCLFTCLSFYLLWNCFLRGKVKPSHTLFFSILVLASQTVRSELIVGQFNGLLVFLLTSLLICEKKNWNYMAGLLLGLCLSIKFFGIVFFAYYLLLKNKAIVLTSLLVFIVSLGFSAVITSHHSVINYFTSVGPEVSKLYQADSLNISPLALPQRIFGGTYPGAAEKSLEIEPLLDNSKLVNPLKYILMIFVLLLSVFRASREGDHNSRFGYLTIGSLAVLPNLWTHSLLVLTPFLTLRFLTEEKLSIFNWLLLFLFFFGSSLRPSIYLDEAIHFWAGLATLFPSIVILLCVSSKNYHYHAKCL